MKYISDLKTLNINFELWLDGSYCTEKLEPNDIDLLLVAKRDEVSKLSPHEQQILAKLADNNYCKAKYSCDVYYVTKENVVNLSYWRGWFGFERDGVTAKGIPFVEI